jgi:hypothetical protein
VKSENRQKSLKSWWILSEINFIHSLPVDLGKQLAPQRQRRLSALFSQRP